MSLCSFSTTLRGLTLTSVCLFVRLSLYPSVSMYLSVCMSLCICVSVSLFVRLSLYPSMFLYLSLCMSLCICVSVCVVLDVAAFERVLGNCMDIMKRNIDAYEEQLVNIFGSKSAITDLR